MAARWLVAARWRILVPPEPRPFLEGRALGLRHARGHQLKDLPDKAGQFSRDRDGHFVALLAAGEQLPHPLVQAGVGFPRAGFKVLT